MMIVRIAKILSVGALASYAFIVAYGSNYQFVRHVLSMDTTFADNALLHRAITSERVWSKVYALIIAWEWLTSGLLAIGVLALLARLRAPAAIFNRAKIWAVAGLMAGFGLWFFGFLVVAGEYFAMWQSQTWNGQQAAFRLTTGILGVLIFVSLPESD